MADRVFFFAGSPTELLGGHLVPPQMVEDLLVIAEIPSEVIDRAVAVLDSAIGFMNEEGLKKLVREVMPEEQHAYCCDQRDPEYSTRADRLGLEVA